MTVIANDKFIIIGGTSSQEKVTCDTYIGQLQCIYRFFFELDSKNKNVQSMIGGSIK